MFRGQGPPASRLGSERCFQFCWSARQLAGIQRPVVQIPGLKKTVCPHSEGKRGTSLMKMTPLQVSYSSIRLWTYGDSRGLGFSYERGTPVGGPTSLPPQASPKSRTGPTRRGEVSRPFIVGPAPSGGVSGGLD